MAFDCHLSPVGRQMAIENSVSCDFLSTFVDSIKVFDCHISGVIHLHEPFGLDEYVPFYAISSGYASNATFMIYETITNSRSIQD